MRKSIFEGCSARPFKPRPLYHHQGNEWEILDPIDKLIVPEANDKSGEAPSPDYKAGWNVVKHLMENCPACTAVVWVQIYQRAAFIRYKLGDNAGAIIYFKKMLDQSPYIPESLESQVAYQIAQMLTVEGDYAAAIEYYDKWEQSCPSKIPETYYQDRASLHRKTGDDQNASYYHGLDSER